MAILFSDDTYRADKIFQTLRENMPDSDLRQYPAVGNPDDIDYAIIWRPKPGSLQNLKNLKAIFTTSAGVDGIIYDDTLPDVPIIRNADPGLATGVMEYAVYHTLRYHRFFDLFEQQQHDKIWKQYPQILPEKRVVGVMGLGAMGSRCTRMLRDMGFTVKGWSRTPKQLHDIRTFHGMEELPGFLKDTEILISILPLTDATRGILNADLFRQLPKGAFIINAGRGQHLIEQDLLAALDNGHLTAATLDVFDIEPLPPEHAFWSHPKITVTPHIASLTDLATIARNILAHIKGLEKGASPPHQVNRRQQY